MQVVKMDNIRVVERIFPFTPSVAIAWCAKLDDGRILGPLLADQQRRVMPARTEFAQLVASHDLGAARDIVPIDQPDSQSACHPSPRARASPIHNEPGHL